MKGASLLVRRERVCFPPDDGKRVGGVQGSEVALICSLECVCARVGALNNHSVQIAGVCVASQVLHENENRLHRCKRDHS